MSPYLDLDSLRQAARALPEGSSSAAAAVRARQATLTKPAGSLGRLEALAEWLARWQGRPMPRLDRVEIIVFAGNHGVTRRGVSPYPAGGAAINQLAAVAGATLRVLPLSLDNPTADLAVAPAMDEASFLAAVSLGHAAVAPELDLLCLGEMGIGNTTAAAAIAAALFGGDGRRWAGRGTGLDELGMARKRAVIDAALVRHAAHLDDPLSVAACLGGRELAAILGAVLAARQHGIPVLLDGFVCTAAAAPLARLSPGALDHTMIAHVSAEAGHRALAASLGMTPLFDLDMRLGEASGAAVAVPLLRAAAACHTGMATFAEAGVSAGSGG
jgi:nicotinate-nucleotide--dimethylbenzimidazole phosphoribosyltransferase